MRRAGPTTLLLMLALAVPGIASAKDRSRPKHKVWSGRTGHERPAKYDPPPNLALKTWKTGERTTGLDAGPFEDGRVDLLEGDAGRVGIDVLRATGNGNVSAGISTEGLIAKAHAEGRVTLVGLNAETRELTLLGDPDGLNAVTASAAGEVFVGGQAEADAALIVGPGGITAETKAGAFVGGKATGEIATTGTLCGVGLGVTGTGEASYGLGAEAEGAFKIDWSTWTVKFGGNASLTAGAGAGAGAEVEISFEKLKENPAVAMQCALDLLDDVGLRQTAERAIAMGTDLVAAANDLKDRGTALLGRAADRAGDFVDGAGDRVASLGRGAADLGRSLCVWCDDEPSADGSNVGRRAPTTVAAPSRSDRSRASTGVGIDR